LQNINKIILWGAGQTGKPWLSWLLKQGIEVPCVIDVSPKKIGQRIHGVEVISPGRLRHAYDPGIPVIAAVGASGAREKIAAFLKNLQCVPGKNLWFVA
jgi:FlaA1/EpsC-like NDP-sugar epimerase